MTLFISNPYTNNTETRKEVFVNDDEANHYYWNLIWSYLNFGVETFVEHCKLNSDNYFNNKSIPFYNDDNWRTNYWLLLKEFNLDYFAGTIVTIENKAHHILEHKEILKKAVPIYLEAGHKEAKEMVRELIGFSKNIIKHKEFIQSLTPLLTIKTA